MSRPRKTELSIALEETQDPIARRDFMMLMGAALGLAGVSACTRAPTQEIVPYVVQPPEVTPGRPRFYATAATLDGHATGILVESHEGRPTKVEGNPDHPASLGACGAFEQASVLSLYDPNRARSTKTRGGVTAWTSITHALTRGPWVEQQGRGLHLLLEPTSSPTVVDLLASLHARWPAAQVHFHAAAARNNVWEGARLAFGKVLEPRFELADADVIVALDSDFLANGPAQLRLSRQFADRRRLAGAGGTMNRLYSVEAVHTVTGASADHRLAVRAHDVEAFAAALLAKVGGTPLRGEQLHMHGERVTPHARFVDAVARDLAAHRGRSLVIAGDAQPPIVHALAHALNAVLGNAGTTVMMAPSPIAGAGEPSHDLGPLADALEAGAVDTLLVLGTNAVYTSPADRALAPLIARARQSAYLGLHEDETAAACTFMIAQAHALESWGDARAFDGTVSIVQPLIEPLFEGRSILEVLALYTSRPTATAYDLVRDRLLPAGARTPEVEATWRRALVRGVVEGTAFPPVSTTLSWTGLGDALGRGPAPEAPRDLELLAPLDPHVHDGRFANNAWLLELPDPIAKLTWTNAATLGPATAAALGVTSGDEIEVKRRGRSVRAAALIVPGQAEGTIAISLGWGRAGSEELARGRGANAFALLTRDARAMATGVTVVKTGGKRELPITQPQLDLEGRDEAILQHRTLDEHHAHRGGAHEKKKRPLTLYHVRPQAPRQWGMAIDLTVCTGCSACVVACQAENNVPTVGDQGVLRGRNMHWLRIDRYVVTERGGPELAVQPMLCQHCERAPCEYVCPVNATVHSDDGLNQMVYNRCVGTRFCSNNCPYKVRRFNWFDFHHDETALEQFVHNPDVTVRERGVMEKCTFCVQRIREHEIHEVTDRGRPPAPLQTACQQACPTRAIVFGDVADQSSEVARLHADERAFAALDDLATVPRVRYLARVRNKNPELA